MTVEQMEKMFEEKNDLFLKNKEIQGRHDLVAFTLLDKLAPSKINEDMVCAAEHDEIFLSADPETFAANATEQDVETLIRCGIRYSDDFGFCKFV